MPEFPKTVQVILLLAVLGVPLLFLSLSGWVCWRLSETHYGG